jgi:bifunctional ADP-heptose synthase (sugar kinase/adenylyltransferase)
LDTRNKILTADAARRIAGPVVAEAGGSACPTIATGYFDVLRAEHVRELRELRESGALLVVVLPLEGELLDQRSRAELVAALRMVDYVVAAEHGDAEALIEALKPVRVARMEAADARRVRELIDHVQRRHRL